MGWRDCRSVTKIPPEHEAGLFLSAALAFVGGYTDAATYLASTVFAGHISGNCVLLAISMILQKWHDAAIRAGAVVFIVVGIVASALLEAPPMRRSGVAPITIGLCVEAALFFIPGGATLMHHPVSTTTSVLLLCVALGLQTGVLRKTHGVGVYTAFMAGMVAQAAEDETDRLAGRTGPRHQMHILITLIGSFMLGALGGTAMATYAPVWTYFVMGAALAGLAAFSSVRARRIQGSRDRVQVQP